jgi:hypothetical protein
MKKKIIAGLFTFLVLNLFFNTANCSPKNKSCTQVTNNDLTGNRDILTKRDWLNGNIKSIGRYTFEAIEKSGKIIEGKRKSSYTPFGDHLLDDFDSYIKYNQKGNYIEINSYNSGGNLVNRSTYKYNPEGDLIERVWKNYKEKVSNKSVYSYDDDGNKIEEKHSNTDGSLDLMSTYNYNSKGNRIEEINYKFKPNGKIEVHKEIYKYDDKDNKIENHFSNPDGFGYCKYDRLANLTEYFYYRPNENKYQREISLYVGKDKKKEWIQVISENNQIKRWTVKYNDKGNEIETIYVKPDGTISVFKSVYKYDDKGNITEETQFDSDGRLIKKTTSEYNKRGNLIKQAAYKSDGSLDAIWTSKFDDEGNKIEDDYFPEGILNSKTTYSNSGTTKKTESIYYNKDGKPTIRNYMIEDHKGNWIEECHINPDGSLLNKTSTIYTYDKYDNWVKKIEFENNIPISITERIIEYYE